MKKSLVVLSIVVAAICLFSCAAMRHTEDVGVCRLKSPVVDTLFLYFNDCEDEQCEIRIRRYDIDFIGHEQVRNEQAFFDIHTFPAGSYTAWIQVGEKFVRLPFYKK